MHSSLCYTILFINKQYLRIIRHTCDKNTCIQPFTDLFTCVKTDYDRTGKKHKQGRNYFIRQHLCALSSLNLRTGPYEDK